MMPGHVDPHAPQGLNRVALLKKTAPLEDQQFVRNELEKANETFANVTITTTTEASSNAKGTSSRPAKLKVHKEKEAKVKKPKATKKNKSQPKEPMTSVMTNTNVKEDNSRPVTMIIKQDEVESRPVTMVIKSYDDEEPTQVVNSSFILVDELLGSRKKNEQKTFSLPPRLEAWELILLLLAGDNPTTGMTYKVFFPDRNLSCNYKSLLAGKKEQDLVPFLMLDYFKNSKSLAILQNYLVIKNKNQSVKTSFSHVESLTIENAIKGLKKEIENRCLSDAGARFNTDEKRSQSTLADHVSKLAEYQIVEKGYEVQGIVLSLTFYRKEEK